MTGLQLRHDLRQSAALSPRLQHAVRLLQMSSLDFATLLRDSLGRNPFLETDESDEAAEGTLSGRMAEAAADAPDPEPEACAAGDRDHDHDGERDLWHAEPGRGATAHADEGALSALDLVPAEASLRAHLHGQIDVLALGLRDRVLAHTVVESLDDDGYLRVALDELRELAGELDPPPDAQELQIALKRVQALDPAGVGARDVAECLLLQLPAIECESVRELARRVIAEHMKALAAHDVQGLARRMGESAQRVSAACDRIRRLNPRPGWRFGSSHAAFVVPDVIVRKQRGEWAVQLNPAVVPRVRLNSVYAELFQRHRRQGDAEMADQLQEARWTVRNVEQRFCTILDVSNAIVRRQRHFLEFGAMAMKPMGLREIADEVGAHESTVSRVTNNKYMATPSGVYELKYFFSRALVSANGKGCSGTAIRSLIGELIEAEPPGAPLSDAQIARLLAQQGLTVARRTVTKYRQMLKITSVGQRRRP